MQPREFYSRFLESFERIKSVRHLYFKELSEMSEEIRIIAPHFNIPAPGTYELVALERDPWNAKVSVMIAYAMALNQRMLFYPVDPDKFQKMMPRKESLTMAKKARKLPRLNAEARERFLKGELKVKKVTIWYHDADGHAYGCDILNMFTHLFDLEISSIARGVLKVRDEVEKEMPKYEKPKS